LRRRAFHAPADAPKGLPIDDARRVTGGFSGHYAKCTPRLEVRPKDSAAAPRLGASYIEKATGRGQNIKIEDFIRVDLMHAIVLGIVQGLTEFLPISSSGHLRIVPALLGWSDPGAAFTAVIQIGTLVAVLAYFRADVARIARAWLEQVVGRHPKDPLDARLGWMMILATVPIVVCGVVFKQSIVTTLRSLYVVAATMIGLAVVLALAEVVVRIRAARGHDPRNMEATTWLDAIVIGIAQALALVPGVSRSGVTITAGLFAGLSRETAARFSFLLSLPAVFAAGIYELFRERDALFNTSDDALALVAATLTSAIVGYASIAFLLKYLKQHTTFVFVAYRLVLGGLLLWWLSAGTLAP
jgi:undecaprenyl-diphosphatase